MKKIGIILNALGRGGAERVSLRLAQYAVEQGIACDVITLTQIADEYEVPIGVNRITVTHNLGNKYLTLPNIIAKLHNIIRRSDPDVLLIMMTSTCIWAIPACVGLRPKVIVAERNDPIHSTTNGRFTKAVSYFLMRFADGYVFQTAQQQNFYRNKLPNAGVVIPNPIDPAGLPEPYRGKRKKILVTAGRLERQKNQTLLIRAFKRIADRFPDYNLLIYGEGALREELQGLIQTLTLTRRVSLMGNVVALPWEIREASAFVLSSDYEGIPNVLLEAMAMGLPCIATDCPCGGPASVIKHGENGLLCETGAEEELAACMSRLLSDSSFADTLGRNAEIMRNMLSVHVIGKRWIEYMSSK